MKLQMLRFGMAGVAGYIVDSLVLYALMATGLGFLRGRLVSFVCAVVVTWLINRRYTFTAELDAMAGARPPLWLEFWRYLSAMALGGMLNLATYWVVMAVGPPHPALPALGVAAGSLVGMVANFASAKWWVFRKRHPAVPHVWRVPVLTTPACLMLAQAAFWICHFHDMALPGLYMDAANPDYLAAHTLNPALDNPRYLMPTVLLPILGNLYHGVQNYYVGLPVFALLGFNMLALRVAQGVFGAGIVVLLQLVLQRITGSRWLALLGSLGLATELAFIASFRTQMYIVMAGSFWLLWAVYLALKPGLASRLGGAVPAAVSPATFQRMAAALPWFLSGLCAGLAVYSYFVFLFFVPVFVIIASWHNRDWQSVAVWVLGFGLGMQTYVLGYLALVVGLGGPAAALEWLGGTSESLDPLASAQSVSERIANAWLMARLTLRNIGNELMIFGEPLPGQWSIWKQHILTAALLVLVASNFIRVWRPHASGERNSALFAYWHIAWLPIGFVVVSTVFGSRLWAHHYSSLVPLMYLTLMLAVYQLTKSMALVRQRWVVGGLALVLVAGNLQQQSGFFEQLEATGGTGRLTNALNRMADDALSLPPELVHVFPEWGFMIPFAFLTANERPYVIDMSPDNLRRLASEQRVLRLYHWEADGSDLYRDSLLAAGYEVRSSGTYYQRDQQPAFLWVEAVVAESSN